MLAWFESKFPVKVVEKEGRGRCVIASRDIEAGSIVSACSPAAFLITVPPSCCYCLKRPSSSSAKLVCSVCKTNYCSKECQRLSWADHKFECKKLGGLQKALPSDSDFESALLLSRVLRGILVRKTTVDIPESQPYYDHMLLDVGSMMKETASSEEETALKSKYEEIINVLLNFELLPSIDQHLLLGLLARFTPNNFSITDEVLTAKGSGVYPLGALFNHSCTPNVSVSYLSNLQLEKELAMNKPQHDGPVSSQTPELKKMIPHLQVMRAIQRIPEGTELCHAYVDITKPLEERSKLFMNVYKFTCKCDLCSAEVDPLMKKHGYLPTSIAEERDSDISLGRTFVSASEEISNDPKASAIQVTLQKLRDTGYLPPDYTASQSDAFRVQSAVLLHGLTFLRKHFGPFHPEVMRVMNQLYGTYMLGSEYGPASAAGEHQVAFYQYMCRLSPTHPLLGMQLQGRQVRAQRGPLAGSSEPTERDQGGACAPRGHARRRRVA
jgi:SET domain/MYND finger